MMTTDKRRNEVNRTNALALALAAALLVSGAAFAQAGPCGGCQNQKAPGQPGPKAMGPMAIPNLTTEQQNQIDDLRGDHIKTMSGLRTDIQIKQLELARLWRADKLDGGKIVAKVKEISELRGKMQVAMVNHHLAVYKLLTPEQQKQFRSPMMGMGRGMRGGRGMGMMGGCGMGRGMMGGRGPMGPGGCPNCEGD
jgi:Spy/CpxP family protein refolding chaperone